MKKHYLLLFFAVFNTMIFAQNDNIDRKGLIERESRTYQKLMDVNVNPNTLNYDLKYQRLELDLDPAQQFVQGTVTSHFQPSQNMSSIYFDVSNLLTVSEVKYHGQSIPFTQLSTEELKIDFPASIPANTLDSLSVKYSGAPDPSTQAFWTGTQGGVPVLATLSEPFGAKEWFVTKQSMNDKIERVDVKITTPSQYSVASNGLLQSESILPSGKKLTFWRTNYAIPAYLVAIGITNYTKINDTMGSPAFPFVNYLYPSTANNSTTMSNINWTKTVMNTFEQYFGPYPYRNEKYGHMEFSWGGGMEHATMSSMGAWSRGIIAHELAHQWFGDKVTCGAWNDIWLNEGFATFGEHVANEKLLMTSSSFLSYLSSEKNYITSSTGGSVYVTDASNSNAIFNSRLSYSKGGYVLRMLKWILGDAAFYQALKDYHNRPNLAYNYAKTADFNASLLQSTGKDFTEFFKDWIYGQGYPTYNIKWKATGTTIGFNVSQTQSHSSVSFFEMPLPIKVTGTGGQTAYFVLDNTMNNQYFYFPVSFTVSSVQFNYEYQILERNSVVSQDANLAIDEVSKSAVKIYPNPVKNELNISGLNQKQQFTIISADGKNVRSGNFVPQQTINVSELPKGVYLIKLQNQTLKFIKE